MGTSPLDRDGPRDADEPLAGLESISPGDVAAEVVALEELKNTEEVNLEHYITKLKNWREMLLISTSWMMFLIGMSY